MRRNEREGWDVWVGVVCINIYIYTLYICKYEERSRSKKINQISFYLVN